MADSICRVLRDGALEGEHAPALTIKDSIRSPLGTLAFDYILAQISSFILAGKSQSRGIVLVAFSRSPKFYAELLKGRGVDVAQSHDWIRVLDCYTDPLGWKDRLKESGSIANSSPEAPFSVSVYKDVRDVDGLRSSILELGKGLVGEGKNRFSVAIDSVSEMLRHASLSSVAGLLSNLRGDSLVSSVFWLLHSDLHEIKVAAAFEYMSSMVASITTITADADVHSGDSQTLSFVEQNLKNGKFYVSFKRRNGRVRIVCEEFSVEQAGIKFTSASADKTNIKSLLPKVQFNLQLSEKEQKDRAKVVLPFEHQGVGKTVQIYDGRKSLNDGKIEPKTLPVEKTQKDNSGRGEIIYFRDSDDEMPDSDEDPDDDLDI